MLDFELFGIECFLNDANLKKMAFGLEARPKFGSRMVRFGRNRIFLEPKCKAFKKTVVFEQTSLKLETNT